MRCVTPLERLFVLLVHYYRPLSAKKVRLRAIFRFLEKVDFKMFFLKKIPNFFSSRDFKPGGATSVLFLELKFSTDSP